MPALRPLGSAVFDNRRCLRSDKKLARDDVLLYIKTEASPNAVIEYAVPPHAMPIYSAPRVGWI